MNVASILDGFGEFATHLLGDASNFRFVKVEEKIGRLIKVTRETKRFEE